MGLAKQRQCIAQINQFLRATRTQELVVCCRREEYEAGAIGLDSLNGAIYLEVLQKDQMREYFEKLNRLSLWKNLQNNSTLLELAQKPLFLFMLVMAYQGKPIRNQQELFDIYIDKQLHDPRNQGTYKPGKGPTPQQTTSYLVWLAKQLENRSETEFLIEGLQPTWLSSTMYIRLYRLACVLIVWFGGGVTIALSVGLVEQQTSGLSFALIFGLTAWLIMWLGVALIVGLDMSPIKTIEKFQWSYRILIAQLCVGLMAGLICGWVAGVVIGSVEGVIIGISGALCEGLICGLYGGLVRISVADKETPNQGIKKTIQYAIRLGLIVGLIGEIIGGLVGILLSKLISGLIGGLISGLIIGGLIGGLAMVIKHFVLRIFLTSHGSIPWNYARFLEHAVKHRFIQRTGGRYRFVHDLLRKHFAAMPMEP